MGDCSFPIFLKLSTPVPLDIRAILNVDCSRMWMKHGLLNCSREQN
jgi:hypothetical protein